MVNHGKYKQNIYTVCIMYHFYSWYGRMGNGISVDPSAYWMTPG